MENTQVYLFCLIAGGLGSILIPFIFRRMCSKRLRSVHFRGMLARSEMQYHK